MTGRPSTGILGGTFDPIHLGHVEAAEAARRALDLDRVVILPSLTPPHRMPQPSASAFHRFAMAALAAAGRDWLIASDFELGIDGPSFTASTLTRLHARGFEPWQIVFITGSDAFAEIASWHGYPHLLDLSHFAVISRPGTSLDVLSRRLPDLTRRMREPRDGTTGSAAPSIFLVSASTPDVSSTEIRRRVSAGEPFDGLLPAAVADHIRKHRLYLPGPAPLAAGGGQSPA